MRNFLRAPALLFTSLFASSAALAQPGIGPWLDEAIPSEEPGELGGQTECLDQSLIGGVQLIEQPELFLTMAPDAAWGRPEMIELITRAAEEMAWLKPENDPIVVGDISRRYGGFLDGHKSHRGGVDVDLGLYWGKGQMLKTGFKQGHPDELDLESNWLFIRSMLDTGLVDRILLDQRIIDRLKKWTVENGELTPEQAEKIFPPANAKRWTMTGIVHHTENHREHMHVRIRCSAG